MANQKEGLISFFAETRTQAYKRKHDMLGDIFLKQLETTNVGLFAENPAPYNRRVGELQREYQQTYEAPLRQRFGVMLAGVQIPLGTRDAIAGIIQVTTENEAVVKAKYIEDRDITTLDMALQDQPIRPRAIVRFGNVVFNLPKIA